MDLIAFRWLGTDPTGAAYRAIIWAESATQARHHGRAYARLFGCSEWQLDGRDCGLTADRYAELLNRLGGKQV